MGIIEGNSGLNRLNNDQLQISSLGYPGVGEDSKPNVGIVQGGVFPPVLGRRRFCALGLALGAFALGACSNSSGAPLIQPEIGQGSAAGTDSEAELQPGQESEPKVFLNTLMVGETLLAMGLSVSDYAPQPEASVGNRAIILESPFESAATQKVNGKWAVMRTRAALADGTQVDYFYKYNTSASAQPNNAVFQANLRAKLTTEASSMRRSAGLAGVPENMHAERAAVVMRTDPKNSDIKVPMLRMRDAGESIANVIQNGKIPADQIPQFIQRVYDQVRVIHSETGVVHRDLNPNNVRVFVNPKTGSYEPVLIDWTGYKTLRKTDAVPPIASSMAKLIRNLGISIDDLITRTPAVGYKEVLVMIRDIHGSGGKPLSTYSSPSSPVEWVVRPKPDAREQVSRALTKAGPGLEAGLTLAGLAVGIYDIARLIEEGKQNGKSVHWDMSAGNLRILRELADPEWKERIDALRKYYVSAGLKPNISLEQIGFMPFHRSFVKTIADSNLQEGSPKPLIVNDDIAADAMSNVHPLWTTSVQVAKVKGAVRFTDVNGAPLVDRSPVILAGSNIVNHDMKFGTQLWLGEFRTGIKLDNGESVSGIAPMFPLGSQPY